MSSKFPVNSDSYLWDEFRSGNEQAFVKIYTIFVDVLFRYGTKFTNDDQLVKDCIQELFIDIYTRRKHIGQTNNIKLYLLKSIKRSILRAINSQSEFLSIDHSEAPFLISYSYSDDYSREEQTTLRSEAIQKALTELTPRQQEAVYLRFNMGLSYNDICEAMDMNNQSVRNLIFRAIEKMRSILSRYNLLLFHVLKYC